MNVFPSENITEKQKKTVGQFQHINNEWYLINESLAQLAVKTEDGTYPVGIGERVKLVDSQKLILSREEGGRLAFIQIV